MPLSDYRRHAAPPVELAFEMQQLQELRGLIEAILPTAKLDKVSAQRLLKQLEQHNAGQERPHADRILP